MLLGSQPASDFHHSIVDSGSTAHCPSTTDDEQVYIYIEVQLRSTSSAALSEVLSSTHRLLENSGVLYRDGHIPYDSDTFLAANVASMSVCDVDEEAAGIMLGRRLFIWQMDPQIKCALSTVVAADRNHKPWDNCQTYTALNQQPLASPLAFMPLAPLCTRGGNRLCPLTPRGKTCAVNAMYD